MTQATIRARIKTTLDTVSNKGLTHDYLRWAVQQSAFETIAKTTISSVVQIRAWMITWRGFSQVEPYINRQGAPNQIRVHTFELHGYLGLDDSAATEKTFAALAELVCTTLDADSTLNADAMSTYRNPTQLAVDEVSWHGHLCHHAAITFQVAETI